MKFALCLYAYGEASLKCTIKRENQKKKKEKIITN